MAEAARAHFLQFCIQWSSIGLLYYDYTLTFPSEIKLIWQARPFKLTTTILYVFCRYALVDNVLYLLAISNKLGYSTSCDTWYKFISAVSVMGRASVLTIFVMRTYALWGKNIWIICGLGLMGASCVALDIAHVPGLRCIGSSTSQTANDALSILIPTFESISTGLVTYRSVQALQVGGTTADRKQSLYFLVLQQGLLYFCIISLFTIGTVILNFRAPGGFVQRLLNAHTLPVSGLLSARFILHLRRYDRRVTAGGGQPGSQGAPSVTTFQAAERSIFADAVDEFGQDPVEAARAERASPEIQMVAREEHA